MQKIIGIYGKHNIYSIETDKVLTFKNLTGMTFNTCKVESLFGVILYNKEYKNYNSDYIKRKYIYNCLCLKCNKLFLGRSDILKRGSRNCGCTVSEGANKRGLQSRGSLVDRVLQVYKNAARYRDFIFDIPIDIFNKLILQNCFYCNKPPSNKFERSIRRKNGITDYLLYNGIDRVNNTKHYTIDNCVTCCKICNLMKQTLTENEFINHIKSIYDFRLKDKL